MSTLTPREAALIANGVYELQDQDIASVRTGIGCEGLFSVQGSSRFVGTSGVVFRSETGFGYLAEGEGRFRGDVLIALRGTATLADGLTDANIGVKTGPSGTLVHAGFADTWNSFSAAVAAYLRGRNPSRVHCVGHSLGGALAMLAGDYFSARELPVDIYTFGCPRVGSLPFAESLTRRIGEDSFHRVSHVADPVPMIPVFPFLHAPLTGNVLTIGGGGFGAPIAFSAHSMLTSYAAGVGFRSWDALGRPAQVFTEQDVENWMAATAAGDRIVVGSAWAFRTIGMVLNWIFRQALQMSLILPSAAVSLSFTMLDRIAWALQQVARVSVQLSNYVSAAIRAIFRFLGHQVDSARELTAEFLRWALGMLLNRVGGLALGALRRL